MTVTTPFDEGDMFSGVLDTDSGPPPLSVANDSRSGTPSLAQVISQPSYHESHHGTGDDDDLLSLDGATHPDGGSSGGGEVSDSKDDDLDDYPTPKNQPKRSSSPAPLLTKKKSSSASARVSSVKKDTPTTTSAKKSSIVHQPDSLSSMPNLSRRSDLFKMPVPIPQKVLDAVENLAPEDWSDSFCLPFHQMMDRLPNSWLEFNKKFYSVTTTDQFHRFLSCELGSSSPMAFLGVDRRGKIRVIHNLIVAPDTGNFMNPIPIFMGLTHSSFDSSPFMFDPDDVDALLLNVQYTDVPSVAEIVKACCFDDASPGGISSSSPRPIGAAPKFRFDSLRFGSLKKASRAFDEADSTFCCKGLFPIHPSLSGLLLNHFKLMEIGSNRCSAPSLASLIFEFIHDRWSISTPLETKMKYSSFPMNHDLVRFSHELFRFLWCAHHRASKLEHISLEMPPDHDDAKKVFIAHCMKIFPKLSPQVSNQQRRSVSFLPPEHSDDPIPVPKGPPPTFATDSQHPIPQHARVVANPNQGVSADTVYMTEKLSESFSDAIAKHTLTITKDKDEEKKEIFKHTTHLRNAIVFGQVGPSSSSLPSSPSEIATELFRQKSTHTLYSTIHARVFRKSDNACYILYGQVGVLQKFGLRWRGNDHPSGFSPFSFDPYCCSGPDSHLALDHDIQHAINESSLRSDNGLSTKDMRDIFVNEKLFCPLTCDEYQTQLRSFYLFACAIWNNECFVALQLHKMVEHIISNRYIYRSSQAMDPTFLCRVLFSLDFAVQRFIDSYLEDAQCVEDIRADRLPRE